MTTVRAPSRLHFGLCDLSSATYRKYGGVGIGIDGQHTEVTAIPAERTLVHSDVEISARDFEDVKGCLARLNRQADGTSAEVWIRSMPPQHVGLGSKTALLLSVLVAASRANAVELDRDTLQAISRRGGASGVGIHTFFRGGLVVDAGRIYSESDGRFVPSSGQAPSQLPLMALRLMPPSTWSVTIFRLPGRLIEGQEEIRIFREATPLPIYDALRAVSLVYHGIVPAVLEGDIRTFGAAIADMQKIGLKRVETAAQSGVVREVIADLRKAYPVVGLSSFGPVVYAISDDNDDNGSADEFIEHLPGGSVLGTFKVSTNGYEVI